MGAITLVGHLLQVGARIVAPHDCYGGSHRLFSEWQRRGEFQVQFVDFGNQKALRAALARPAALLWIETPSNPLMRITDIAAAAALATQGRSPGGRGQHLHVAGLAAAAAPRRRPRRALDDQVHQRAQRCGGRGRGGQDPRTARAARGMGQLPGADGFGLRQLPDAPGPAHAARAPRRSRPQRPGTGGVAVATARGSARVVPGLKFSRRATTSPPVSSKDSVPSLPSSSRAGFPRSRNSFPGSAASRWPNHWVASRAWWHIR